MVQRRLLAGTNNLIDLIRVVTLNGSDVKRGLLYCAFSVPIGWDIASTRQHKGQREAKRYIGGVAELSNRNENMQ